MKPCEIFGKFRMARRRVQDEKFTMKPFRAVKEYAHDAYGGTALEYVLIAALISVVAILSFGDLGEKTSHNFDNVSATLQNDSGGDQNNSGPNNNNGKGNGKGQGKGKGKN